MARGGLLSLLIVVAIIMFAIAWGLSGNRGPGRSSGKAPIVPPAVRAAVCASNRDTLRTHLAPWLASNSGATITPAMLGALAPGAADCPSGGAYLLSKNRMVIYCTLHNPPPPEEINDCTPLFFAATPTPTPASSSTLPAAAPGSSVTTSTTISPATSASASMR